jgi:hypothetical protein
MTKIIMKPYFVFILSLMLLLVSCKTKVPQNNSKTISAPLYEIYKIDSVKNYYIIYAKKDRLKFKILSKKQNQYQCDELKINSKYLLQILPLSLNPQMFDSTSPNYLNRYSHSLVCYPLKDSTDVCVENGITDIYFTKDIVGLCFIKN